MHRSQGIVIDARGEKHSCNSIQNYNNIKYPNKNVLTADRYSLADENIVIANRLKHE